MLRSALPVCLLFIVLTGCSSQNRESRGWIGGMAVASTHPTEEGTFWNEHTAVLTHVPATSPAAQAGLAPSDAILAIDGEPVPDGLTYRELIEKRCPGDVVQVDVWRCGQRFCVPVTVGREELCEANRVMFGLGISPGQVDLWPFDNGINVMRVVQADHVASRYDLDGPVQIHRRCATPCRADGRPATSEQEVTTVGILPVWVSRGKQVVKQEAVAPARP